MLISQITYAQYNGIVLDIETNKPIPYVNIHTTLNKNVLGTTTNSQGLFSVSFSFKSLIFSHVNYEKAELTYANRSDTIFLTPGSNLLNEVVISNKQPEWINDVLRRFISERKNRYRVYEKIFSYKYHTRTLNDSNGYAFKSEGEIVVPQIQSNKPYSVSPKDNVIHYKDNSAGVDFSNLQRILYEDILLAINSKFVKSHEFRQNYAYKANNENVVQLVFNAKQDTSDSGYLVIDTVSATIMEIERTTGTDININMQTSSALRVLASETRGFNYDEWVVYNYVRYGRFNDSYYPVDCKYKLYMKSSQKNKKRNDSYFVSTESEVVLKESKPDPTLLFMDIPRSYYMLLIKTKKMRLEEEQLNNVRVRFDPF